MTYLETITYEAGHFVEVSQYALKNAYRVAYLYLGLKQKTPYTEGLALAESCEANAKRAIIDNQSKSSDELLAFFADKGLSTKEMEGLKKMLYKRDYLLSHFFLDHAEGFAKEEVAIYEDVINELREYVDNAKKLNASLSKSADKLFQQLNAPSFRV